MKLNNAYNHRSKSKLNLKKITIIFVLILMIIGVISSFLFLVWISQSLPSPGKIRRTEGFTTTFYDKSGKVIYQLYKDENRVPVSSSNISKYVKQATVSVEDKNFFEHKGFSSFGFLRAMIKTLIFRQVQGGSTLTQQLVKNTLLTSERTLIRKIKELILASEIERRYTKDQILEMYLNEAPYGGTLVGIESAAKGYFNVSAKDLTLAQSVFLAGLPQRPNLYSPYISDSKAYLARSKDVLRRMKEDKIITKEQEKSIYEEISKMKFSKKNNNFIGSHFIFYLIDEIERKWGKNLIDEGIEVYTTLSLDIQKEAEQIIKKEIDTIKDKYNASNASAVVIDTENGDILAMVGSYDFSDEKYGKFNTATSLRQPGSSIKPITFATALEKGYTASSLTMDVKTSFTPGGSNKTYTPQNYDGKFRGPIQMRFALGNSINIPAVKILASVGIRNMMEKAFQMGIKEFEPTQTNLNKYGLSLTLGGGEARLLDMTNAFAVFSRGGQYLPTRGILKIKTYNGKTIYSAKSEKPIQVFNKGVSFIISHILSDNNARSEVFGASSLLNVPGKTVAVKTGTTDDKRDNWAIGFTKSVSIGVWVGNNDNSPMNQYIASGVTGATPIWNEIMQYVLKTHKDGIIDKPDTVEAVEIDAFLGGLPKDGQPKRTEYFIKGTEPKDISSFYRKLKISKQNGKLANDFEIKTGNYDEKEYVVIEEDDPISTDGINYWQKGIDEWRESQDNGIYKYPIEKSDSQGDEIIVSIKDPKDKEKIDSNRVVIKANITTLSEVKYIEIYIDDNKIKTINENKKSLEEALELEQGSHIVKVRAENDKGKSSESTVRIGIKEEWKEKTTQEPTTVIPNSPSPTVTP